MIVASQFRSSAMKLSSSFVQIQLFVLLFWRTPAARADPFEGWFDSRFIKEAIRDPSLIYFHRMAYLFEDISSTLRFRSRVSDSTGRWYEVEPTNDTNYHPRLENCVVYVPAMKKVYMIGGVRSIDLPVDIYDPFTRTWSAGTGPGVQLDHFQCVVVDDKIWIPTAWDNEVGIDKVIVYDPASDTWDMTTRDGLPEERRRGGAAAVVVDRDIYVLFGNQGGHKNGTSVVWADKYNIDSNTWSILPDGNFGRDHTGGGYVDGRICVAGGRIASQGVLSPVLQTECFDPINNEWDVEADIPGHGRSGSAYGMTVDGQLMVAGGEYEVIAESDVHTFDGSTWTTQTRLRIGRHGTFIATIPECNQMILPGGSSERGSGFMLQSTDVFYASGEKEDCVE